MVETYPDGIGLIRITEIFRNTPNVRQRQLRSLLLVVLQSREE
jgi:hypothetical protein